MGQRSQCGRGVYTRVLHAMATDRKERRRTWWTKRLKSNTAQKRSGCDDREGGLSEAERGKVCGADGRMERVSKQTLAVSSGTVNPAGFKSSLGTPEVLQCTPPIPDTRSEEETTNNSTDAAQSFDVHSESGTEAAPRGKTRRRYIAFIGNLPFTATREDVIEHFSKRGVRVTEARLLTRKSSGESKGCCFLECPDVKTLQNALKFHHTLMEGRRLNVEVTCGGGGRSEGRATRIKIRNEKLRKSKNRKTPTQQT